MKVNHNSRSVLSWIWRSSVAQVRQALTMSGRKESKNSEPIVRFIRAQTDDLGPIFDTRVASYLACLDPEPVKYERTKTVSEPGYRVTFLKHY